MSDEKQTHATALDNIIEKYTATPKNDPELVDYALRQVNPKSRRRPFRCRSRRGTTTSESKREQRAS